MKRHYHLLKLIAFSSPALLFGILQGQENDPFVKDGRKAAKRSTNEAGDSFDTSNLRRQIFTTIEIFSLPTDEAAKLHRLEVPDFRIYESVLKMVEEKNAKQEFLSSLACLPGQRASNKAAQKLKSAEEPTTNGKTHPNPIKSKESEMGLALEIEPQLGMPTFVPLTKKGAALLQGLEDLSVSSDPFGVPDPKVAAAHKVQKERVLEAVGQKDLKAVTYIALNITPTLIEQVALLKTGEGLSDSSNPLFDVKKLKTQIMVASGETILLGTFSPTSKLKEGDEAQGQVWLAFVTATAKVVGL